MCDKYCDLYKKVEKLEQEFEDLVLYVSAIKDSGEYSTTEVLKGLKRSDD